MAQELNGKKVAILVENGFEQEELTRPKAALEEAGAQWDTVKGWDHTDWGENSLCNPDDIPAFNGKMIEEFAEGLHRQ